jgi:hypothetical protein
MGREALLEEECTEEEVEEELLPSACARSAAPHSLQQRRSCPPTSSSAACAFDARSCARACRGASQSACSWRTWTACRAARKGRWRRTAACSS